MLDVIGNANANADTSEADEIPLPDLINLAENKAAIVCPNEADVLMPPNANVEASEDEMLACSLP